MKKIYRYRIKDIDGSGSLYFQAEELNAIVGNAFKMAYAQEREKQPTFNELIEQQLIQQKAKFQVFMHLCSCHQNLWIPCVSRGFDKHLCPIISTMQVDMSKWRRSWYKSVLSTGTGSE